MLTTLLPFTLAPMGGQMFTNYIHERDGGEHYASDIIENMLVGLYRGSIQSFYVLLTIVWFVGVSLINPDIADETKQWIRRRVD